MKNQAVRWLLYGVAIVAILAAAVASGSIGTLNPEPPKRARVGFTPAPGRNEKEYMETKTIKYGSIGICRTIEDNHDFFIICSGEHNRNVVSTGTNVAKQIEKECGQTYYEVAICKKCGKTVSAYRY